MRIPASIEDDIAAILDPFGNAAHTALSFDLVGEDVLITGAGPIGCLAAAIARHAGARHVVITDVNPYRLELAKKMGATLALDVRREKIGDAQKKLGMKEGFDVGMEMSGNPDALRSMLANMCHGAKIAMLDFTLQQLTPKTIPSSDTRRSPFPVDGPVEIVMRPTGTDISAPTAITARLPATYAVKPPFTSNVRTPTPKDRM